LSDTIQAQAKPILLLLPATLSAGGLFCFPPAAFHHVSLLFLSSVNNCIYFLFFYFGNRKNGRGK
jgi:hypothetical protein